jgi:uncharacterized protein (DUF1499 family)
MIKKADRNLLLVCVLLIVGSFSAQAAQPEYTKLAPCPASPNCVSSLELGTSHGIEPFVIQGDPDRAWAQIRESVLALPRTKIVSESEAYLHVQCLSRVFRFVDNLELEISQDGGMVSVRSASVSGYSDMGVNRRRVESLRAVLLEKGVLKAGAKDS